MSTAPVWAQPALAVLEVVLRCVRTSIRHIVSVQKQRRLFAFLCINGSFMVVEFLCGVSVGFSPFCA
jgi:hypothetical protein